MDNQNPYTNPTIKYGPQPQPGYNQNYMGYGPNYAPYNPMQPTYPAPNNNYTQQQGPTLQSMNQNQVTPVFGRWIDSPSEIAPKDVPMDGTIALFPSRKGDRIYAKAWDSNGAIATIEFQPVQSDQSTPPQTEYSAIMEKLTRIEERLNNRRYDQKKENKDNA